MELTLAQGSYPPMITPMTQDASAIDPVGIKALIDWHIDAGSTGAFVVCSTGEMFDLTPDEMVQAVETAVIAAAGRIPVVGGLPFPDVESKLAVAQRYEEVGASGTVALQPFEDRYDDDVWYEHYMRVADGLKIPVLIYEHPKWKDMLLTPSLVGRLAASGRYIGMKDCTGDLCRLAAMAKAGEGRFGVMQAVQQELLSAILCGGSGACCTASNALPHVYREMWDVMQDGDIAGAYVVQQKIRDVLALYGKGASGHGAKRMLNELGLPINVSWRKGGPLSEEQIAGNDQLIEFVKANI
jgi:4-hydroxy-tetrahydrodipicolinate synthase